MSYELTAHVRDKIDDWKTRFPADQQRSAVIRALHLVQHENKGFLTAEQMNAVADYLSLPTIQVYEVATFYSMFQTKPVGRNEVSICTNVAPMTSWTMSSRGSASSWVKAPMMAGSSLSARKSVLPPAAVRRPCRSTTSISKT